MSGAVPLALTPAPLLLAIGLTAILPARAVRSARLAALLALPATVALLLVDALPVIGGGRVLASFGDALPGIPYLFRADSTGMVIAMTATATGVLVAVRFTGQPPRRIAALLACVVGSVVAALAGNAVLLFAGVEIANVGTFALLSRGRGFGRGALAALAIEHITALGLLAAAANLQVTAGTSDFSALPGGAVTPAVAVPWAVAGAARLLAPAISPLLVAVPTAAWGATAAIPAGAAVLLRLREAAGGALPPHAAGTLAAIGATVAVLAAVQAVRQRGLPARAGRALCVTAAGTVLAVAGFNQATAGAAVAVGLGAVEIAVGASMLWEGAAAGLRALPAAALLVAGGLPVGLGTTAIVLEVSTALGVGRPGLPLALTLGLTAAVAAAAAVQAALSGLEREPGSRPMAPLGLAALAAAAAGALVPGAVTAWLGGALGATPLADVGAGAIAGPEGGWAGGYFAVAGVVIAAGVLAAIVIAGRTAPAARTRAVAPEGLGAAAPLLRGARAVRRPYAVARRVTPAIDAWLAQQPQMPLVAAGSVLAVVFIR